MCPPRLASRHRTSSIVLIDGGAGDRTRPGGAIDAGLDLPVRLFGATGDVADQAAALAAQSLSGRVGRLPLGLGALRRGFWPGDGFRLLRPRLGVIGREE